jgi:hypothetical protein
MCGKGTGEKTIFVIFSKNKFLGGILASGEAPEINHQQMGLRIRELVQQQDHK